MLNRNKSILKNTIYLLAKLVFSMVANLYISRVVLDVLGVTDFGIYNVVTGVVIMLTMITGSLSSAISRFLNFEMGKEAGSRKVSLIYSTSLMFHISLAIITVSLGVYLGDNIINNWLNIPLDRRESALIVLFLSVASFAVTLISITFNAVVIANEDMKVYSAIGILDILVKLTALIVLNNISYDKLELYSALFTSTVVLNFLVFYFYVKLTYRDIRFTVHLDKTIFIDICSFAGWNSIGTGSVLLKEQGVNILINVFFGAQLNAARAISYQVSNALSSIVNHLMLAVNPRITKLFASNNSQESIILSLKSARYSFYFMLALTTPLIIEVEKILDIWLIDVPDYTVLFVRLIIINLMIDTLSNPLITLMLANGKIRNYQIIVGFVNGLNFPISYLLLTFGFEAQVTIYVSILISCVNLFLRLYMLSKQIKISIRKYIDNVVVNVVAVCGVALPSSLIIAFFINSFFSSQPNLAALFNMALSTFICIISIFFVGCSESERMYVFTKLKSKVF
ncbi:oligosaccharide flippase family protein [Photobacterium swingsii]|uniref:oligosaccharide flippase family protein n=1 Tax=Photobacterium swingsii TaxID=680026 RepID=UPI004068F5B8